MRRDPPKDIYSKNKTLPWFQSALTGDQQTLQCLAACCCDLTVLFIYCYCGEIVTQACDISTDLYHTRWYNFDRTTQRAIGMAIARTQKPYHFAPFESFNCSLEVFSSVSLQISWILSYTKNVFLLVDFLQLLIWWNVSIEGGPNSRIVVRLI